MNPQGRAPDAWLVIASDGFKAVFLQQATAMNYAVRCRGIVKPLYCMDDE